MSSRGHYEEHGRARDSGRARSRSPKGRTDSYDKGKPFFSVRRSWRGRDRDYEETSNRERKHREARSEGNGRNRPNGQDYDHDPNTANSYEGRHRDADKRWEREDVGRDHRQRHTRDHEESKSRAYKDVRENRGDRSGYWGGGNDENHHNRGQYEGDYYKRKEEGRERNYQSRDRRVIEEGRRRREEERALGITYTEDGRINDPREREQEERERQQLEDAPDPNDPEAQMAALMGFGGFSTTKKKGVEHNAEGGINVHKQRTWRQYMNRRGGFNRPLDKVKD
nr:hypothetical protein L204_05615 [Cryptococcus depauperatus CBS 7855]